jgi:hypothetical protein
MRTVSVLLRRFTEHLEEQNWFAVGLDLSIVVVGVFIGLQVQQWANEKERVRQETEYLQRLHNEVETLISTRQPILETRNRWHVELQSALQAIFDETTTELTDDQCRGIAYNYYVSNPTDHLGSLLELQSSGQTSIIRNARVSQALQDYLLTRARARDSQAQLSQLIEPSGNAHPHLVQLQAPTIVGDGEVALGRYLCDLEGMRANHAFLQDLELAQSLVAFHYFDNSRVSASLQELRNVLDDVLSQGSLDES